MISLMALGLLDIIIGLAIGLPIFSSVFMFWLGLVIAGKGLFSIASSFSKGFYLEWIGAIDLAAGIILITGFGFPWFGIIPFLKGVYSFVFGFFT